MKRTSSDRVLRLTQEEMDKMTLDEVDAQLSMVESLLLPPKKQRVEIPRFVNLVSC